MQQAGYDNFMNKRALKFSDQVYCGPLAAVDAKSGHLNKNKTIAPQSTIPMDILTNRHKMMNPSKKKPVAQNGSDSEELEIEGGPPKAISGPKKTGLSAFLGRQTQKDVITQIQKRRKV